jgi:hypothetical protein
LRGHEVLRSRPVVLIALAVLPTLVAACATGGPNGGAAQVLDKAPAALCGQLNAVLSDGPDPGADPVGYALSQILPLGQIHTSDGSVATTVRRLIAADRALVDSKGADRSATKAITEADKALNVACPGVAP